MLIPDTATSLLKDKTWSKIKELNSAGYKILMCAVVASKGKCEYNGSTRQRNEGKIYSSIGWSRAMTREITRKKQLSYAHSKFTKTAQTQVQALFNKCRKNKINPELPSIVINNDDWDNVSMDVLKAYNLMDWNKKVVWDYWKSRDLTFYENRRRSVGAEIPRPPPLFIQKDVWGNVDEDSYGKPPAL